VIRSNIKIIEKKCAGWNSENPKSPGICPDTPATLSGVSGVSRHRISNPTLKKSKDSTMGFE
jgi:hypothetical protein